VFCSDEDLDFSVKKEEGAYRILQVIRSFLLAVRVLTRRLVVLRLLVFRPLRFLVYLRVYFFRTFEPAAHFLAAFLNAARHLVLPLMCLPFSCFFIHC
jgi:hypothetical protein